MTKTVKRNMRFLVSILGIFAIVAPLSFSGIQISQAVSGVTVTGRIVSPTGLALSGDAANAWIQMDPEAGGSGYGEPTNQNGIFTFSGIPAGSWRVQVNYNGSGNYVGPDTKNFNIGSSNTDLGDIRIAVPQVTGTALAPTGSTTLKNVDIGIRSADYTTNRWGRTDEDNGTFKFGGLRKGTYIVTVSPNAETGYTQGSLEVNLPNDNSIVTGLTVRATNPNVVGIVKKPDGTDLTISQEQNQWVNIDIYNQDRTVQMNTNADENGNFKFGGLPAGSYTIEVRPQNMSYTSAVPKSVTIAAGGVTNVGNVRLTTPKLQGTVTDPEGEPVQNVWVQVHNEDWSVQSGANTNESGQYVLGGLANGSYMIELNRPGERTDLISPDAVSVTLSDTLQTKNLQFVAATKFVRGKITRSNGEAITNAQVNANKEGGNGSSNTNVNAQGRYELALGPGIWNVQVQAPWGPNGQVDVDWVYTGMSKQVVFANNTSEEIETVNIQVTTTNARIVGKVVSTDGTPESNANVDVRNQEGTGVNTQIKPDGSFSMRLLAGSYRLNVWSPDQSKLFPELGVTVGADQVKDVGTIRAMSKDARIVVKAVKADGTGIAGLRIGAFKHNSPGNSNSTTDENGVAELAVIEGRWGINIETGPEARYVRANSSPIDIDLPESNSTVSYTNDPRLLIKMTYADAEITGHVVTESGDVVTGFCSWAYARPNSGTIPGEGMQQDFGAPIDCQTGAFTMYVPSKVAGTFTLGMNTPPNSMYLPKADQNVAVFADTTTTKDIEVQEPDARVYGQLIDQSGEIISSCQNKQGFGGWVNIDNQEKNQWFGSELRPDCTYSVNLLSGDGYSLNVWTGEGSGFLEHPPSQETFTVNKGDNKMNYQVVRADRKISGRVTDPDGNGVDAQVFAHTRFEGGEEGTGPTKEDFKNEKYTQTKTDSEGYFELGVVAGQWEIGGGLPPDVTDLLPPQFEFIDMTNKTEATVNLSLQRALGQMTGALKFNGQPLDFGFVACWDDIKGTFMGAPADWGSYALNYVAGTFTCQANSFNGNFFFQSDEVKITFTDDAGKTQDFDLTLSDFEIPAPIVLTFDASKAQTLTFTNGTTINISSGALASSGNVTVTATPTVNLRKNKDNIPFGAGYEFTATNESQNEITSFTQNVTITFTYNEDQLANFGLTEDSLTAKFFAEDSNTWQTPSAVSINTDLNEITVQTNHFTTFAVLGSGGGSSSAKTLVVTPKAGGGPQVTTWNSAGERQASFFAYDTGFRGGVTPLMADLDGDGNKEIITAPYSAGGPHVRAFNSDGEVLANLFPYTTAYRGGLSLSAADVDGDGVNELIVAPSGHGGPHVRIYDYADGTFTLAGQFFAYASGLRTGMTIQTGDTDGDGSDEIVTTTNTGAAPHVRVFDGSGNLEGQFFAYATSFRGGVNATVADVDSDGQDDVIVSPMAAGGPHVRVMRPDGTVVSQFFAYPASWRLGIKTGVGDVDGDGLAEIVTAPQSGGPHIRIFSSTGTLEDQYMAYMEAFRGGVELIVSDIDGDGKTEVITGPKVDGGPHVRIFNDDDTITNIMALHPAFRGGINIAVSK
ncbi:MAG: carboxypeptidase regulatory-like domain-containing protein [bacterium]